MKKTIDAPLPPYKRKTRITGLVLIRVSVALSLATVCALHATVAGQPEEKLQTKRQSLNEVKQQIQRIKHQIDSNRQKQDRQTRALRKAEQRISRLTKDARELSARIAGQNRQISHTAHRLKQLQTRLDASRKTLADQIRAAYRMGRQSQLKLLLTQHNPSTVERVMTYYDYLIKARNRAISDIQAQSRRVGNTESELKSRRDHLERLHAKREKALAGLQKERGARQSALGDLEEHLQSRSDKLAELKKDRARLKKLIGSLRQALKKARKPSSPARPSQQEPFNKLKGKLPWPLHGKALARFGQSKSNGQLRWQGIWLAAPQGEPVHAVAAGTVVYVGWMPSYGLLLIVDHGHGYYSLYAHNQAVSAQTGDTVKSGQEIARAGDTGGHERSGVYLEIRKGKKPLNPGKWLSSRH